MSHATSDGGGGSQRPHKAGAFDVRNVIAGLIGFYGLVLLVMAFVGDVDSDKTGGVNANLWAGLAMLVFALAFALWSRLRPVVVDPRAGGRREGEDITGDERPRGH